MLKKMCINCMDFNHYCMLWDFQHSGSTEQNISALVTHVLQVNVLVLTRYIDNSVCWACLLLFCLVLSGPLLTSQQAGCTQKLKKLQLFDHLERGSFFHSQQLTAQKGGKQSFLTMQCRLLPAAWNTNSGKSQEISTGSVILKVWWLTS